MAVDFLRSMAKGIPNQGAFANPFWEGIEGGPEGKIAGPNMKLKSSVSKNISEPEGDT